MAKRVHNVIRPKGQTRPFPKYIVDGVYHYRGREIELTHDRHFGNWQKWYAQITVIDPKVAQMLEKAGVSSGYVTHGPSPDEPSALRYATFVVDSQNKIAERGFGDLWEAIAAVRGVIDDLAGGRAPGIVTRANVARALQVDADEARRSTEKIVPIRHEGALAFERLPLDERVELIDEMVELVDLHGGRYPNPRAELLATH